MFLINFHFRLVTISKSIYVIQFYITVNMDLKKYNSIIKIIRDHKGLAKDCLKDLQQKYPQQSKDTLYSILSFECQRRMKMNHSKDEKTKNKYWSIYKTSIDRGDSPGIILRMSSEFDVEPCLVAKLILQKYFEDRGEDKHSSLNMFLRNTTLIDDMDLSYEVYLCSLYDIMYSPSAETMKQSLGQQYEVKLTSEASRLGLAFKDEEQLRQTGYDKTPDIKLEVPVAMEGFVINWIESKALFGEPAVHKEYMRNQYASYWNRFGSGLIIYWFGYLENIVEPNDRRFIIRSYLPTDIVYIVPPDENSNSERTQVNL